MFTLIKSSGRSRPVFQVVKSCFSGSRKNTWKRWIDLALYLVSCALLGTGLLLAYRFPHGHGAGRMATFLGYARHEWGTIHTSLAWVAIFLVVFHLIWNREWVVKIAASGRLARLAAGIFAGNGKRRINSAQKNPDARHQRRRESAVPCIPSLRRS